MTASQIILQVTALLAERRFADAASHLEAAAAAGDAAALAELARWRVAGNLVRRDLTAARDHFARAGAAGDRDSALLHAAFLAAGVGGPGDWPSAYEIILRHASKDSRAAGQARLLRAMQLDENGNPTIPFQTVQLSAAPHVEIARGFLTTAECDYLAAAGEPALQPSVVVDPASGQLVPHPIRNSDGAAFGVFAEDLVVNAINRRIATLSGTRPEQGEPLQLLRYRPGNEYRAHMDVLPGEPNQRVLTVIVYLSDGYDGGETEFVRTGLRYRGGKGDAILFRNVTADGRPDALALHAGLPVTRGTKLIATRWIRRERFTYPPPQPLLDR